jgi:outer membrane protein assembly factor BamB
MDQIDPQHTGRSPHAGPRQARLLRAFETAQFETPEPGDPRPEIQSSAAIGPDGTMYIGNFPGTLLALRDPGRGEALEVLWRFHPAGASSFHTTPALGPDGTVYVGFSTGGATPEAKGTFYALKAPTSGLDAQVLWSVDLGPGRQTASPTLGPDGTVYVVSGAGKLFALAPDGTVKWTVMTGPSLKAAPALGADGTVYLSSMNGKLYAVAPPASPEAREGSVRWTFDFGAHPGQAPAVTASVPPPGADAKGSGASPTIGPDGTIYVGANNSNFYAIAPDGTLKWMYEAEREVAGIWSTAALSADGNTVFFGANKGGIYALDRKDGSLRWRFDVYGSVYNSPTLDSRGTLYTGSTIGHVFALDSATGEVIFDYDAGAPVWTAPAIRPDGSLLVGDTKGRVMLLGEGQKA